MMNLFILGTDLTLGPGTARTGDTESDTGTSVPTPGTGRGRGSGTGRGTGARGTESGRGNTTGSGVEAGTERSTGNTMKTGTDIGTGRETGTGLSWHKNVRSKNDINWLFLSEIEEKMRESEIQDHLRPELRRSPEEKRHETRKGDRISWGKPSQEKFLEIILLRNYLFLFSSLRTR